MIVLGKDLRRHVADRRPVQFIDDPNRRYETFRIVSHTESELIDHAGAEDVNPAGRPTIIFVKIMRADSPAVGVAAWPAGGAESFIVRSPPLGLPVNAVLGRRLEIETIDITVLGYVNALLKNVAACIARCG